MTDDGQLLRQYVRQGSQAAFAALVARHLNFVYSVCQREAGDAALAEDVTQVVFLILAKKAPTLRPEPSLTGWLFQTARFAARNARRRAARRKEWEARALAQTPTAGTDDAALWDQVGPALNDALATLGAKDREAVLLRFADGLSFPELGTALGTSEDAARMRLNRAVERLRQFFAKQGVTLSVAGLTVLLADRAVQAAPAACAASVTRIAESISPGAINAGLVSPQINSHLQGVLKAMTISKLKLAATLGVGAILAGSLPFVTLAQTRKSPVRAVPHKKTVQIPVDQSAVTALEQATRATAALQSLSADVEANSLIPPGKWSPLSRLTLNRPAQAHSELAGTNGQTSIVNGGTELFYTHWDKQYQQELNFRLKEDAVGPPLFSTFFFNPGLQGLVLYGITPSADTPPHSLGTKRWHGGTYTAVQYAYTSGKLFPEDPIRMTVIVYFGADHLLHGYTVDATYRGKRTVEEYALKNLHLNPTLPDTQFVFTPPAGAQPSKPAAAHMHKTP